jgi:hypothetical protein
MATTTRPRTGTALTTSGPGLLGLDALAREAGIHPQLARRLLGFGLVDPSGGTRAVPLYRRGDAALLARAARLRRDLGLNYAGAVLACELLGRIDELERRLPNPAPAQRQHEVIAWTRIG